MDRFIDQLKFNNSKSSILVFTIYISNNKVFKGFFQFYISLL